MGDRHFANWNRKSREEIRDEAIGKAKSDIAEIKKNAKYGGSCGGN
jgi:hypothetical protein